MKKLLAALVAGAFVMAQAPAVFAQDKAAAPKADAKAAVKAEEKKVEAKAEEKKADAKAKAAPKAPPTCQRDAVTLTTRGRRAVRRCAPR